ncbi:MULTISPECIES: hypothetical protein [Sphingobacterium]|uniref:hypothetical protein n=1 Tax=Sphingobacterium TaxID=28453 RepID=UPI0013DCF290|nr:MULTISPECIES: hypothetical protein [unclassified Sphingobacterium]
MKKLGLLIVLSFYLGTLVLGQEPTSESLEVDDIQIDVKSVALSKNADTATVELFLISYKKGTREFKLNSFASGIVDSGGKTYLYNSMQIGKVLVQVTDRQNYIHYLLEEDEPVRLIVKTIGWKKQWGKPQQFKLAFEDSEEEGKFLEVIIDL